MQQEQKKSSDRFDSQKLKKQTSIAALLFAISLVISIVLNIFVYQSPISYTEVQASPENAVKTTGVSHPTNRTTTIRETYTLTVRLDDGSEDQVGVNNPSKYVKGHSTTFYRYSKDGALYESVHAIRSTLPAAKASVYANVATFLLLLLTVVMLALWQRSKGKQKKQKPLESHDSKRFPGSGNRI